MIHDVQAYALIKLAAKLAKDGHGENAQFLRDCIMPLHEVNSVMVERIDAALKEGK